MNNKLNNKNDENYQDHHPIYSYNFVVHLLHLFSIFKKMGMDLRLL